MEKMNFSKFFIARVISLSICTVCFHMKCKIALFRHTFFSTYIMLI